MTVIYATDADYATWTGAAAPANITTLLRSASLLIAEQTVGAFYDTDPDTSLPTDPVLLTALKEATCAQAAMWSGLGIDPLLAGLDVAAPKRSKGIGTARVEYDTSLGASVTAFQARQDVIGTLCPEAQRILRPAGLLVTRVWTYG